MSNASAAPAAPTPAQVPPATAPTPTEHAFRGGGGGRGRGRGRGQAGGRGNRYDARGRGRFQGTPRLFRAESDGKYQENLILGVGTAVRKEAYKNGYIQNFYGEYGDIARCMESDFTHPNDAAGLTRADTVLPDVDTFDWHDPSTRARYDSIRAEKNELREFFSKRALLHGKIIAKLTQEVHDRMLDQYPPEFFGGETPTYILMDAIYEKMIPVGVDKALKVKNLKTQRLLFRMKEHEKPRDYVLRAKELKAQCEIFDVPFEEEEFVNEIAIPGLTPAYAEVAEQRRKFRDYPRPDPEDQTAMAQYLHLVEPVATLDELTTRLQKVHVRNPFEYLNFAGQQTDDGRKRGREIDGDDRAQKKGAGRGRGREGRGGGRSGRAGRGQEVRPIDRVQCHECGQFGHRARHCSVRKAKNDVANFFDYE